ncbi:MAG TPA: GntR family transcriptional regulator [Xanthobacteraceae bacterium]|nr:GntR family transcriptional regulator [Xanthobacteraceae bacterium]
MPAALVLEEPLERLTLGEQAYARLADLLISGRLAPGEKLSLRGSAEILGVSIMPVRAAVSRLVADKALEVAPNRAIRVPVMSAALFRDITANRVAIEGRAAALAAERRSDDDIAAIASAEAEMRAESTAKTPNLPLAVEANKRFHFAVYQAAKSPTLIGIIRALWLKVGPVINLDLRENPERIHTGGAVRFHAEVLDAIRRRDPEKARAALASDIQGASDFILSRDNLPD